jgi:hypothetical protein
MYSHAVQAWYPFLLLAAVAVVAAVNQPLRLAIRAAGVAVDQAV